MCRSVHDVTVLTNSMSRADCLRLLSPRHYACNVLPDKPGTLCACKKSFFNSCADSAVIKIHASLWMGFIQFKRGNATIGALKLIILLRRRSGWLARRRRTTVLIARIWRRDLKSFVHRRHLQYGSCFNSSSTSMCTSQRLRRERDRDRYGDLVTVG